jgi:mono/diheme cytochrome c family protein
MRWNRSVVAWALAAAAWQPEALRALDPAPGAGHDPAAAARAVFAARCAGCHGPDLPRPRGRFGYVLDLRRVAGNPEMVIPFKPDESELWLLVHHNEMPPPDTPSGPLTAPQKEAIRAWIAAGAPAESVSPQESTPGPAAPPNGGDADRPPPPPPGWRALLWLGKFHLLLVHFPIALLAAAAAGDLWSLWRGGRTPLPAVRFCLCLGAAAALPTVALGFLHAFGGSGAGLPRLLSLHRWLGAGAGLVAVAAAALSEWDARRGVRSRCARVAIPVAALLVALTAHLGGILTHGEDFFDG